MAGQGVAARQLIGLGSVCRRQGSAEVAGIVAATNHTMGQVRGWEAVATAWLHDSMEDQGVTRDELGLGGLDQCVGVGWVGLDQRPQRLQRVGSVQQRRRHLAART